MRAAVFAYHDVGCAGLASLLEQGHDVTAVFTHADDPGEPRWFGSVADLAAAHGIPVHRPDDGPDAVWLDALRAGRPQAVFSFYYRRLLPPEVTELPVLGAFNLHGSLLPRYRGRCPLNWVLVNGESETGVTLHHMSARLDAGDIVAQRRVPIDPEDTAPTLHGKIVQAARLLLAEALPAIARGTAPRMPQDPTAASYFGARRPEDGRLEWTRPARALHNLVRAVTHPWPGAFTRLGSRTLRVWASEPDPRRAGAPPGHLLPGAALEVATGEGRLRLLRCQLEGEPATDGRTFAERHRLGPGVALG
jgi:UDP-4-amino-4-deoxy-L-arabinose formyltransferase/UDP-glucuronic acid dehydrogenase (UDP-4-keto-hexauronic acid decarboxylating)